MSPSSPPNLPSQRSESRSAVGTGALVLIVAANSVASTALGLTRHAAPGTPPGDPAVRLMLEAIGAPAVAALMCLFLGPSMALAAGAVLVTVAGLSVPLVHGFEAAAALAGVGHGVLLTVAIGWIASEVGRSQWQVRAAVLVALATLHLLAGRLTEAWPHAESEAFWLVAALLTVIATVIVLAGARPTGAGPTARRDPPARRGAMRGILAGVVAFPVVFGGELRPATELGRLAPVAAARELALHAAGEIVVSLVVVALLVAWRSPRPWRIAGVVLMDYGASLGLSPVWLGIRAGALLAPLQIAGNLVEGTGALVVPLGLSWAFGAYSPRMAGFTTGVLLAVVGAAQLTGQIAVGAALGAAQEPRATLLFLALLSATAALGEGIALWTLGDRSRLVQRWLERPYCEDTRPGNSMRTRH